MLKAQALLSWLLPCCADHTAGPAQMEALLDSRNIGILSAACCDTGAAIKDDGLKRNLAAAMAQVGDPRPVIVQTITAAQQQMRALQSPANAAHKQLVDHVVALFQGNGLSVFPLLIVDGRVAFYGGVPSVEMLLERLQKQPLVASPR